LYGQIKKAVEVANQNKLYNLSLMISQINSQVKTSLLSYSVKQWQLSNIYESFPYELKLVYEILSSSNIMNVLDHGGELILSMCGWKNIFIIMLILSNYVDLYTVITNFEEICSKYGQQKKNILPVLHMPNSISRTSINFLLIKYFSILDSSQNLKEEANEVLCNLFSSENMFPQHYSTHHVNYIIISFLNFTLYETYNWKSYDSSTINPSIDFKQLKILNQKLLNINIEELLQNKKWFLAINLVKISDIPDQTKERIVKDILFKFVELGRKEQVFERIYERKISLEAGALFHYYRFDFKNAYENFKETGNFQKASEIFIFYKLCAEIIQNENEISCSGKQGLVDLITVYKTNIYFHLLKVFDEYLNLMMKVDKYRKLDKVSLSELEELIQKIFSLNQNDISHFHTFNHCKNVMLDRLRTLYNKKVDILNYTKNVSFSLFLIYLESYLFAS
jgi:hypothetical protein